MSPNILRSVVKQVTLAGRSVVSRRNLSTRPRRDFGWRPRRRSFSSSQESYSDLFGSSLVIGVYLVCAYEFIQMLEYGRTMQKSLDEVAGKVSKSPMRDFLLEVWRMNSRK